jgi:hypothetical protein
VEEFKEELPPRKRAKRRVFKEESESAYDESSSDFEELEESQEKPKIPKSTSIGI